VTLRSAWLGIGWLLVLALVWGSVTGSPPQGPELPHLDKLQHAFGYGVLMGWFWPLYGARGRWLHAVGLVALGVVLEFVQEAGGVRQFEVADMVADAVGVAAVFGACRAGWCRWLDPLARRLATV
jgi:hypothetical protein